MWAAPCILLPRNVGRKEEEPECSFAECVVMVGWMISECFNFPRKFVDYEGTVDSPMQGPTYIRFGMSVAANASSAHAIRDTKHRTHKKAIIFHRPSAPWGPKNKTIHFKPCLSPKRNITPIRRVTIDTFKKRVCSSFLLGWYAPIL